MPKQQNSIYLRGIRVSESGNLDNERITTIHIDSLQRLPDTADEIKSIAAALEADSNGDIFLGKHASEQQVKTMDLSDRSIIAFATHALVPGDLDGLDQPALALSAPAVTSENEDGLLKMEEILQLKLNADWVVLSACNTGAAQGECNCQLCASSFLGALYPGGRQWWPRQLSSRKAQGSRVEQRIKDEKPRLPG